MWNQPDFYSHGGMGMHAGMGDIMGMGILFSVIFVIVFVIAYALKAYALWHSARRGEMWWFVALFIINSMGILELVYIIFVLNKFHKKFSSKSVEVIKEVVVDKDGNEVEEKTTTITEEIK
jgi:methionyl-tRNA synthetase